MTITVQPARNEYTSNAGQTIFNYTFKIFEDTDLNVYVTPAGQDANDSTDLTTAYTVSGVGDASGGSVTLTTPTSLSDLVTIVSNVPSSRTTDYQNNGDFRPDTVNADFDRVVSIAKKVEDLTNRALLTEQAQQGPKPLSLPQPSSLALLRWKDDKSGLENIPAAFASGLIVTSSEEIVLADGQTLLSPTLDVVSTSLYVNGSGSDNGRLALGNDYTVDVTGNTIDLNESYPAGTIITLVVNEPQAGDPTDLTQDHVLNFPTLAEAVSNTTAILGNAANLTERTTGNGGGAMWDYVDITTVTVNGFDVVACTGVPTLALVLRLTSNVLDVLAMGAVQDGSTQTSLIQRAIDRANNSNTPILTVHYSGGDKAFTVKVPQGVGIDVSALTLKSNVTLDIDTGTERVTLLNGENISGAVNEQVVKSGFHPGMVLDVHNDWALDTLGAGQDYSNRASYIIRVNGFSKWQLANDIDATSDDDLTLYQLNSSLQRMHWNRNGSTRYGRRSSIQDFTPPLNPHVICGDTSILEDEGNASGSAVVTITRSGSTATVTETGHARVSGQVIYIQGADQTEYNGRFEISNITANGYDYTVSGAPVSPATGVITAYNSNQINLILRAVENGATDDAAVVTRQKILQLLSDDSLGFTNTANNKYLWMMEDNGDVKWLNNAPVRASSYANKRGTFTPTLLAGGVDLGSVYNAQDAKYTEGGDYVDFDLLVYVGTKSGATGNLTIGGLPFPAAADGNGGIVTFNYYDAFTGLTGVLLGRIIAGSSVITLYQSGASGVSAVTNALTASTPRLYVSGRYRRS